MAALRLFERKLDTVASTSPAPPHRLYVFGDCIYELSSLPGSHTSKGAGEPPSKPPVSCSAAAPTTGAAALRSGSGNGMEGGTHTRVPRAEAGIALSCAEDGTRPPASTSYPSIVIQFVCPIPHAQLNRYNNLDHALSTALREVAPHCTYGLPSPIPAEAASAAAASLSSIALCIPAYVTPKERCAAAAFAADLSLHALRPVLEGLLQHSSATMQQECLLLLPHTETMTDTAASQPVVDSASIFSAAALFVTATPTPTAPVSPGTSSSAKMAPACFYSGTVSLTVCIGTDDKGEAALMRRYLDAFADVKRAPVLLLVRESAEPPPGVAAEAGTAMTAEHLYAWWCTFVLAPHQMISAASVEQLLRWARELRPTVLFHVHRERMAMHALLRQQLSTYAARFD
ncbi:putative ARP2/3 complex subunit [Leishmania major strain Friedlin]|uniref:ARPC-like protein n=1 Tax=Leishmania major TaxID=5664 RepID=Q4QHB4_LEIMA|nr:putative ARP2/3 complex subunit [Leishmania major strain Friedlin]ABF58726.1 ARPC-like protein [Leishmania major]CAG9570084.1 ARP2/3_complex_subunit_-_putative [Leishmania major strain Friedlin]CAJ02907.1 putative ARP2/3 complex subunit [Leishmania major strain Friedlin]|eukprot:XP_001681434.1 putative ARP2/3 complex subunit [Leishmania major strain Friedlin]